MGVQLWSDGRLIQKFGTILEKYPDITQDEYDELKEEDRPGRATLVRRFGSFEKAKILALNTDNDSEAPEEHIEYSKSREYLINQNERLRRDLDRQRNLSQVFVENCLASIEKLSIKPVKYPLHEKSKEQLEFHSIRSDAQVGQKTDPRLVQGISEYNIDIYKERVHRWTSKIISFRQQDMKSLGLNRLIIHHVGDQVEGEAIFAGQAFYLDSCLTDQLFQSVETEVSAILTLAGIFPEIEIYAVAGNHGRPGAKGMNHVRTNFDYIFYRALQTALIHQPNVKVYVSESPSMIVKHGNFIFLLNHGDNAKGYMGIPFYGLERMFRRLHDLYSMKIDYQLIGHHHQPLNISDRIIMNGSLPGGSDLSINRMGITNLPSQKIFYFDPEHGINRESNLHLADSIKLTPDEHGIFTSVV